MSKYKIYEITYVLVAVLTISYVIENLVTGSFYIVCIIGLFIYILLLNEIEQLFIKGKSINKKVQSKESDVLMQNIPTLFEYSSVATIIVDKSFRINWVNMLFEQLMQKDSPSNNAMFTDFLSQESINIFLTTLQKQSEFLVIPPIELETNEPKKNILIYLNKLQKDAENGFIINIVDVTNYKTLENNFVHSQKMQALGQLSGTIAHDFNNLLTAIIGFSDLLLLKHLPGDSSFPELMQIKQNANRAATLVKQLLAFSKKQVMKPRVLNVIDLIEDLSHLLMRLIGTNINLEIEHEGNLKPVKADQSQLEQIIVNLVVNARDAIMDRKNKNGIINIRTSQVLVDENFDTQDFYSPPSSPKIETGEYIVIEIADNGTGIKAKYINQIFEPFFSTKQENEDMSSNSGTGLGLATVCGIVEQLGGFLFFKTKLNYSTSFFVFLKTSDIVEDSLELDLYENINGLRAHNEVHNKQNNGSIMIVEDEGPIRLFCTQVLSGKGYNIIQAENAESAWKIIKSDKENIDLIITDVSLGGMSGVDLLKKVRAKYPYIKFIFTSGYAENSVNYLSKEEYTFLSKPFSIQTLLEAVNEVFDH